MHEFYPGGCGPHKSGCGQVLDWMKWCPELASHPALQTHGCAVRPQRDATVLSITARSRSNPNWQAGLDCCCQHPPHPAPAQPNSPVLTRCSSGRHCLDLERRAVPVLALNRRQRVCSSQAPVPCPWLVHCPADCHKLVLLHRVADETVQLRSALQQPGPQTQTVERRDDECRVRSQPPRSQPQPRVTTDSRT